MSRGGRFKEPVGVVLDSYLREHDLTQVSLAVRMQVDQSTVSRLVSRHELEPLDPQAVKTVERLAAVMGVEPDAFLEIRLYRVQKIVAENPKLADVIYDLLVGLAAKEAPGAKQEP